RTICTQPLTPTLHMPLFPYTTLFRSILDANGMFQGTSKSNGSYVKVLPSASLRFALGKDTNLRTAYGRGLSRPNPQDIAQALSLDRKSTRLNSSHVSISYAVFCLKKK